MKFFIRNAMLAACLMTLVASVHAEVVTAISAIQVPAWVERNGVRTPAQPGMELHNRDRLVTGGEGRAFVQLPDGSLVKLGSDARVEFNALGRRNDGAFGAAIDVITGAFRFTTDALRKVTGRRAINVRVGTITAGIRGTDIWGRSQSSDDLICLLEGHIVVSHPMSTPVELTEPLQFYGAARGEAPGAVSQVTPEKIAEWSLTTEPLPNVPLYRAGPWWVRLGVGESESAALAVYDRAQAAGYPARVLPLRYEGTYRYEVLSGPLADRASAESVAPVLAQRLGLEGVDAVRRQAASRGRQ